MKKRVNDLDSTTLATYVQALTKQWSALGYHRPESLFVGEMYCPRRTDDPMRSCKRDIAHARRRDLLHLRRKVEGGSCPLSARLKRVDTLSRLCTVYSFLHGEGHYYWFV